MNLDQYITFKIEKHLFGINILKIREITGIMDITIVPHTEDFIAGLINLRGQVVIMFDLGVRIGLRKDKGDISSKSKSIIFKSEPVGLLVDEVGEVMDIPTQKIENPPAYVGNIEETFIEGVIPLKDKFLVLLSPENILWFGMEH